VLVPRSSGTPVATWAWPIWVVSRRRVLEAVFILLVFPSPSRRIFIGSHSLPPSLVCRIGPSPIRSTDSNKTLGIVGTPHGHTIAKRNQRNPARNSSNPRTPKTPKSSPFAHGFGREIKGKRTTKGSCIHPPPNPKEKGLEITPRKSPRKGSENHQKERTGRTHPSLEEPRRIIYTSQRGSYKV
jgi:hypothetical protein